MARYIDAEAFKRKLIDEKGFFPAIVAEALEEMPEADVVPADIGEWLENEDGCQCSNCGIQVYGEYDSECMPVFCSNCFARMYCPLDGETYQKVEHFKREKRARVAREVFEEIEKIIEEYHSECYEYEDGDECDTAITYISYISADIDELKKKYTGGE